MEIIKTYAQSIPATRFIGKKYGDSDSDNGSYAPKWGEFFGQDGFAPIESAAGGENKLHSLYEDADAYIGLMRANDKEPFEYWIGEFTPVDTPVPDGYGYVDFPAAKLAVAWVKGTEPEVYQHMGDAIKALADDGMVCTPDANGTSWYLERYQCPRFTTPDENGEIILDIAFFM